MTKLIALIRTIFTTSRVYHTEYVFKSRSAIESLRTRANPTEQLAISAVLAGNASKQDCRVVASMFTRFGQSDQFKGKVS